MPTTRTARPSPIVHARYLSWAGRACSAANRNQPTEVLDRRSFDFHLFRWAIGAGRLDEPEEMTRPMSSYVAEVFRKDPEAVKAEARRYWRQRVQALT